MGFDYIDPGISEDEVQAAIENKRPEKTVAPAGTYTMELRSIRGREYGNEGKHLVEIYARHADQKNFKFTGANLVLFRMNDGSGKSTSARSLLEIGKALGLSADELKGINWAVDTEGEVDEFGNLPAALLAGADNILAVEGLVMKATIDVETFDRRDGSTGEKNVIKGLYAITDEE